LASEGGRTTNEIKRHGSKENTTKKKMSEKSFVWSQSAKRTISNPADSEWQVNQARGKHNQRFFQGEVCVLRGKDLGGNQEDAARAGQRVLWENIVQTGWGAGSVKRMEKRERNQNKPIHPVGIRKEIFPPFGRQQYSFRITEKRTAVEDSTEGGKLSRADKGLLTPTGGRIQVRDKKGKGYVPGQNMIGGAGVKQSYKARQRRLAGPLG